MPSPLADEDSLEILVAFPDQIDVLTWSESTEGVIATHSSVGVVSNNTPLVMLSDAHSLPYLQA